MKPVPLKLVPVMTTCFPTGPNVGQKQVMVGAGAEVTVKFVALVPVPLGVVTRIAPVVAPVGTVTVIWVAEFTVKLVAATLFERNSGRTSEVRTRDDHRSVQLGPMVGANDVIVGTGPVPTVKLLELVAVATGVTTWIGPVVAPAGTNALIWVDAADEVGTTANVADVPLKSTEVAFSRFVPMIVTAVPTGPDGGKNDVIVGTQVPGATVKFELGAEGPSAFDTTIGPVVAAAGTVTLICVLETASNSGALAPLNVTPVVAGIVKLLPVIVMRQVPAGPELGANDVIVGATANAGEAVTISSISIPTPMPPTLLPRCRLCGPIRVLPSVWGGFPLATSGPIHLPCNPSALRPGRFKREGTGPLRGPVPSSSTRLGP